MRPFLQIQSQVVTDSLHNNIIATYVLCVYRVFGFEKFPFKEWLLVDLDFSMLNISLCNDSQYTTWVPTDEV